MAEKIISKGSYPHPSIPNFVSAKQYMVIKQDGKRQLFLRFENPRGEAAESISFTVNRYNTSGELIGSTDVFSEKLKARAHSAFTVNSPVDMEDDAADFKVVIHSVRYGDYLYVTHNDEVETVYDKRVEKRSANDILGQNVRPVRLIFLVRKVKIAIRCQLTFVSLILCKKCFENQSAPQCKELL